MIKVYLFLVTFLLISSNASAMKSGLLILDMESYFIIDYKGGRELARRNKEKLEALIEEQVRVIRLAKKNNVPILATLYGTWGNLLPVLKSELSGYQNFTIIRKEYNDLFSNGLGNEIHRKKALNFLDKYLIDNLVVMGANGGACVQSTIIGALKESYTVKAYPKGIADFNYHEYIYPYYLNDFAKVDGEKSIDLSREHYEELGTLIDIERLFNN